MNNIWCIGRNYSEHAKELGNTLPSTPLVFLKAGSCVVQSESSLVWPQALGEIHYETELAVELDANLKPGRAAVALDFTAREIQDKLKKQAHPWTLAKSFRQACGLGALMPVDDWSQLLNEGEVKLWVNDEVKQHGFCRDMIFTVHHLIEYMTPLFPLCPGDVILTGTPSGVGPLKSGDRLKAEVSGLPPARFHVGN